MSLACRCHGNASAHQKQRFSLVSDAAGIRYVSSPADAIATPPHTGSIDSHTCIYYIYYMLSMYIYILYIYHIYIIYISIYLYIYTHVYIFMSKYTYIYIYTS